MVQDADGAGQRCRGIPMPSPQFYCGCETTLKTRSQERSLGSHHENPVGLRRVVSSGGVWTAVGRLWQVSEVGDCISCCAGRGLGAWPGGASWPISALNALEKQL